MTLTTAYLLIGVVNVLLALAFEDGGLRGLRGNDLVVGVLFYLLAWPIQAAYWAVHGLLWLLDETVGRLVR